MDIGTQLMGFVWHLLLWSIPVVGVGVVVWLYLAWRGVIRA